MAPMEFHTEDTPSSWLGLMGRWTSVQGEVVFEGADPAWQAGGQPISVGVAGSSFDRFTEGDIELDFRIAGPLTSGHSAGVVLGFKSFNDEFYYAEFGDASATAVAKYEPGLGFRPLVRTGPNQVEANRSYRLTATLHGQRVIVHIDGVKVVEATLPQQAPGHQVGLIASGTTSVTFSRIKVRAALPRAFVATQFSDQFDRIWLKVIKPTVDGERFRPVRIDEVAGPTPILADIKRQVAEAAVVIAEITPLNPNVFYEVGYADALNKPLILLAQNGTKLPFDISGYRTVFYEDVIGGEESLAEKLRLHLKAIL